MELTGVSDESEREGGEVVKWPQYSALIQFKLLIRSVEPAYLPACLPAYLIIPFRALTNICSITCSTFGDAIPSGVCVGS